MKKLVLLASFLGLFNLINAQVWETVYSPDVVSGKLLGVNANGNMYMTGDEGIYYSETGGSWQFFLECIAPELCGLTISQQGRVFVLPNDQNHILYTDDNGLTWHQSVDFLENHLENAPMCAVSNDTLLVYGAGLLHWTFDAGTTWNQVTLPFIEEGVVFGDMIVDSYYNVFISTYNWLMPVPNEMGIFNASLQHLDQWHLWESVEGGVKDMDLDHVENVYATTNGSYEHPNYRLYLIPADRIGVSNNITIFTTQRVDDGHQVLAYSTNHGQSFTQFGELLPSTLVVPDTDMEFFMGLDQHLYCFCDDQPFGNYRRSGHIADNIVSGLLDHTWDELVTSCNEEVYVVDDGGNVQIWSAEGLAWLISTVNGLNGQEPDDFAGRKVTIKNDLDMSGAIWTTLGQGTNYGTPNPDRLKFCGTFDGGGHEISGLYFYSRTMEPYSSFFGDLCGARIENVKIRHAYASGRSDRDGLFFANADSLTVINNCRFEVDEVYKSDLSADYSIFGYNNEGTITNCMTRCHKVTYPDNDHISMDQFVYYNNGTIQNCATVADSLKWLYAYSGIANTNNGLIENCYSFIGGFFGDYQVWWPPAPRQGMCFYNHGTIRNCYYNSLAEYDITDGAASSNMGTIENTSPFVWQDEWLLTDNTSLIEALNTWIDAQENSDDYNYWCPNAYFLGHQLPEFGNYPHWINIYEAPRDFRADKISNNDTCQIFFNWLHPQKGRWINYDEHPHEGSYLYLYWGIRIPADNIQFGEQLTHVAFFKGGCQGGEVFYICVNNGDDTPPGDPAGWPAWTSVTVEPGPDEWINVELRNPLVCEEGKSVWIMLRTPYHFCDRPASYCQTSGNPDARWASDDGYNWIDCLADDGVCGDWMIRGYFNNNNGYGETFDHYNLYRGRTLATMEKLVEVDKDSIGYTETLYAPYGGYFYQLTAAYTDGRESNPALTTHPFENNYLSVYFGNISPLGSEWYYEIENEDGSITYQQLSYVADTTINDEPVKIIVKINTLYDKGSYSEERSHEYIYEDGNKVYWWNKTLGEFTLLYDFGAEPGYSWVINVGMNSLLMQVNQVEQVMFDGISYRVLHVSDPDGLFSGSIVSGIGHMTSFFPERLMKHDKDYRVDGIRCYWQQGDLVFKYGERDCDEIYEQLHHEIDELDMTEGFLVYPNPSDGTITVSGHQFDAYRITNVMGQTVMSGTIDGTSLNLSALPAGMYFIIIGNKIQKLIVTCHAL